MKYKHSCVIDANFIYKTLVLVLLVETEEHQQEEQIQYYELLEGEMLVDTAPPVMRPYAGAVGLVRAKWDTDTAAWTESATDEEIFLWEKSHPAQAATAEEVRQRRDQLLAETDWTQIGDSPLDEASQEAMRLYRQALRDVPEQSGFPGEVVWPDKPQIMKEVQ